MGFEPTVRRLGAHTISSRAPSAARAPLLLGMTILRPNLSGGKTPFYFLPYLLIGRLLKLMNLEKYLAKFGKEEAAFIPRGDIFFALLLFVALVGLILDWETGSFTYRHIHIEWYFHFWIAFSAFILSLSLTYYFFYVYGKTHLEPIKYLPLAFLFYGIGVIIMGFHDLYCKTNSDLGFCGSAHNYPNVVVLLILYLDYVVYLSREKSINSVLKKEILKFLLTLNMLTSLLMMFIIFVGLLFMKIPSDLYYRKIFNLQGLVFISIQIYAMYIAFKSLKVSDKTLKYLFFCSFLIISFLQSIPAYHIFTCYWCYLEECSEFFCIGGLFILFSFYFFGKSIDSFVSYKK